MHFNGTISTIYSVSNVVPQMLWLTGFGGTEPSRCNHSLFVLTALHTTLHPLMADSPFPLCYYCSLNLFSSRSNWNHTDFTVFQTLSPAHSITELILSYFSEKWLAIHLLRLQMSLLWVEHTYNAYSAWTGFIHLQVRYLISSNCPGFQ